jgi:hypothetical protein
VVSRWACRKRRRRNSPCIREDVPGVGSAGEPAGGGVWSSLTQFPKRAPPSSTRFVQLGDAGRQEPAGSPPVLHGVGSAGVPAGGKFGPGRPSYPHGSRPRSPVFSNWEMRTGGHPRTLSPCSSRRGEYGGARGGPVWARMVRACLGRDDRSTKTSHTLVDPMFGTRRTSLGLFA